MRIDDPTFIALLKQRAEERPSWGYRQLFRRMRRVDGIEMNSKKFRRIYTTNLLRFITLCLG
jgi:hypothetical protein